MRLADLTTMGVGGAPDVLRTCMATNELIERVRGLDDARERVLILGGGSNILMSDDPFHGTVLQIATRGIEIEVGDGVVRLTVAAGEPWDALVELCVVNGWSGIEALSGIPGLVGATPIQNVGAYGQEISQVIESVRVLDRANGSVEVFDNAECLFEYRSSIFKRHPNRWLIVAVTIELRDSGNCLVRYAELATALGIEVGGVAAPGAVRSAVLALRAAKGMVLDVDDEDSRSVGSFFTNPIVTGEIDANIPPACPRYPATGGIKLSAAWLIEQAGVTKGWCLTKSSRARVSNKHTLAIVAKSGATAAEVIELAAHIQQLVLVKYAILLEPEPTLVNCSLAGAKT
ncbi:MAG: UDP-N-acetylmuramate dehydrogenase [Actinomycetota bacterium]|nr:UDP-N-acetylmuramate dehydrogenase [Actinomycetota bacterium]